MIEAVVFKEPLMFGDMTQIQALRDHEKAVERERRQCGECEGEGTIVCCACEGRGIKRAFWDGEES